MFLSLTYYVFLIYFLSGFIYLVSDYILSKQRYIFIKHVLRVFFFLFFWPFIFLKALRLYLKIGKYLKLEGRWQLFFTSEVSQNPDIFNGNTSESNVFFKKKENEPF